MAKGPTTTGGRLHTGGWRTILASRAEIEASDEREHTQKSGCRTVAELQDRCRAELFGVLRSVTLRPRRRAPALEAELFDGTGTVRLIWLGQRRIVGVEPGRRLRLTGFVARKDGQRVMYNPRYELMPRQAE